MIDLEISLFCKQTGPKYVNKWLKQISLPFLYSPWIVETPELCYKKWPDFYLKLSRSISVNYSTYMLYIFSKMKQDISSSSFLTLDRKRPFPYSTYIYVILEYMLNTFLVYVSIDYWALTDLPFLGYCHPSSTSKYTVESLCSTIESDSALFFMFRTEENSEYRNRIQKDNTEACPFERIEYAFSYR